MADEIDPRETHTCQPPCDAELLFVARLEVTRLTRELEAARAKVNELLGRNENIHAAKEAVLRECQMREASDRNCQVATERAERATELLRVARRLIGEFYQVPRRRTWIEQCDAFLIPGGAPTFESLAAATGELPTTGLAAAEPPPRAPTSPMELFPDPRTVCAACDGTGRETGLAGYDEPCRECDGTGRPPATKERP